MKKFFSEFKAFITRGNVLDMAVGIIIGGAFTAIITAIVGNILTPLINWIPGSGADGTGALQVVLRSATFDAEGNVLTEALIIDFGAVISAIVTFLITAFVLFLVVKTINTVRAGGKKFRNEQETFNKAEYKALRKQLKAEGMGKYEIDEAILAREQEKLAAAKAEQDAKDAASKAEALANAPETLLREIRDLLARQTKQSSGDDKPSVNG